MPEEVATKLLAVSQLLEAQSALLRQHPPRGFAPLLNPMQLHMLGLARSSQNVLPGQSWPPATVIYRY